MRLGVRRIERDRPPAELLGARGLALLQRLEHAGRDLVERERHVEVRRASTASASDGELRGRATLGPGGRGARRTAPRARPGARPASNSTRAACTHGTALAALGEVAGGVQRVDRVVGLDRARRELRDGGVGPLLDAGVTRCASASRSACAPTADVPAVGPIAVQARDRRRQHRDLLGAEDARRDGRVLADEPGDVAAGALVDPAAALDGGRATRLPSQRSTRRSSGSSARASRAPRDRRARRGAGARARAPRRRPCAARRRAGSAARWSRRGSGRAPARRRTPPPARAPPARRSEASANTTSSQRLTSRSARAMSPAGPASPRGSPNSASIARRASRSTASRREPRRIEVERRRARVLAERAQHDRALRGAAARSRRCRAPSAARA